MANYSTVSDSAALQRRLNEALRKTLGQRPKGAKAFREALGRSFKISPEDVESEARPATTISVGETEVGLPISQARLSAFARVARDFTIPRLNRLYALRPDADEQQVESTRSLVIATITNMVTEMGAEGGPNVVRVNEWFEALGVVPIQTIGNMLSVPLQGAVLPASLLAQLQDAFFGPDLDQVDINTVEEQQDLTDYLIVVDSVMMLYVRWQMYLATWQTDFSRNLILLRRALAAIVDSVGDLREAMDEQGFDADEEEGVSLHAVNPVTNQPLPEVSVAEWLNWALDLAANEGPELIEGGGRRGVQSLAGTLEQLKILTDAFLNSTDQRIKDLLTDVDVRREANNLRSHIEDAQNLAQ